MLWVKRICGRGGPAAAWTTAKTGLEMDDEEESLGSSVVQGSGGRSREHGVGLS